MKPETKTTDDVWKLRFLIITLILLVWIVIFVGVIFQYESEIKELEKQIMETKESAVQIGQNSTVNYIIGNKKYPTKFKGNIVWLTKRELCEDGN